MRLNLGRTGCKGLIYDGVNIAEKFQIVDMSIPLLPSITTSIFELPQRTGAYFASRQVGTREIVLKLRLDAESRDPMQIFKEWRQLSDIFNKSEPKKLILNEDKYCYALFVGESTIENEAYYGNVEFNFICYDPYFYGDIYKKEIKDGSVLTFPVRGAVCAFPTLDLTATSTQIKISNENTGDYVLIPNVKSGAKIHIEMEKEIATVGGAYAPVDLLSDYFSVMGNASVKVTGANGTLEYQERFI